MPLYFYDKYQSNYNTYTTYTDGSWGSWSSASRTSANSNISGYTSYSFSSSSGYILSGYGTWKVGAAPFTLYNGGGASVSQTDIYAVYYVNGEPYCDTRSRSKSASTSTSGYYSRGSFIETVTAQDGTYPDNGRASDGYWYVKGEIANDPPSAPTLVYPVGGETIAGLTTIQWNPSTDTEGDSLNYEVELSLDDGSTWNNIGTIATVTEYAYDFSGQPETALAKIRIRATDPYNTGPYATSGTFTLVHKSRIGEQHIAKTDGTIITIPIYDPAVGMENKNQLRTGDDTGVVSCYELVSLDDPIASPFRFFDGTTIRAIAKQ